MQPRVCVARFRDLTVGAAPYRFCADIRNLDGRTRADLKLAGASSQSAKDGSPFSAASASTCEKHAVSNGHRMPCRQVDGGGVDGGLTGRRM